MNYYITTVVQTIWAEQFLPETVRANLSFFHVVSSKPNPGILSPSAGDKT